MNFQDCVIGMGVVRSKGGENVGRTGEVICRDEDKQRVRVAWKGETKTWVAVSSVQPLFIAYRIIRSYLFNKRAGCKVTVLKYEKL